MSNTPFLFESLVVESLSYVAQLFSDEIDKSKDGIVIESIQIQNLNINLTADVVHQLNMNPQEVINQFTEPTKRPR